MFDFCLAVLMSLCLIVLNGHTHREFCALSTVLYWV
jgi:hypothetical protein